MAENCIYSFKAITLAPSKMLTHSKHSKYLLNEWMNERVLLKGKISSNNYVDSKNGI